MNAIDRPFTKIINGATQFIIPVFQRDYSWTDEQCEQLWKDILNIATDSTGRRHFIGSVVYVSTGDSAAGFTRWLLIDGQQRLTTLTLLLTALRDHILKSQWTGGEDGPTAKRIEAYFLKNVEEAGAREQKLVLRGHDHATLCALLNGEDLPQSASEKIRDNYEFFLERLADVDPEQIYKGIDRLVVVDVTLDRGSDDPQSIFESLNSTGLDLSQSDLIRNFILMRLPEREQTRLYKTYWSRIEELFRGSERVFDAFVRDYVALVTKASKQERAEDIYAAFRREFGSKSSNPGELETLLQDLLRFARYHAGFSIGVGGEHALREPLARLRRLIDVPATLVMRLFECRDQHKTLSDAEFTEALNLIESYVFRRAICGEQTRGYWQVFANMAYRVDRKKPLQSLLVGLSRQHESYRFPTDAEFREALEKRDIYGKRVCLELLARLENEGSRELTDTSKYSIEHIMPQNEKLSAGWRAMLGPEWRDVQREWLHRLGNLTLTGYNSTYSDRSFVEKKTIAGGFSDSSVRLNKFVRDCEKWTPVEMEKRGKALAQRALSIWPPLVVDRKLVEAADRDEIRARAMSRSAEAVEMSPRARELFEVLRSKTRAIDGGIVEVGERHSVSYHCPEFFLEVLPRRRRLNLLLAPDFNEIADPAGIATDASEKKFFVNAVYAGGVNIAIWDEVDIANAIPIIRQAHAIASKP